MHQYLLLIHGNASAAASADEWDEFFAAAQESGFFKGGSALGERAVVGESGSMQATDHIVGFMRFDAEAKDPILRLLEKHPVVRNGGTVELCEMSQTG